MDLTPSEKKYAEKSIRRLEKDSRQWPLTRWIMLIGSILMISSSVYLFNKLSNINELVPSVFSINPKRFNSETVEIFVKGQLASLRLEIYYLIGISLSAITAVHWLAYCLINWNRHLKSAIMAKAFHRLLSEK